ncbi:MAG TPA: NADPH-dependent F420 reductase [Gammaproteobacteria bacterium]|nr:NADPH-dependent F420 reductase [Gammaproteobacteria bacterium]
MRWLKLMLVCASVVALAESAAAETIALIGTGNVGAALGRRFAEHGHTVTYGSRNPADADVVELVRDTGHGAVALAPREAAARSRIVVLAVPWTAAEDAVRGLGDLSGKIVVDPTNPRVQAADGFADYPPLPDSNAERIARLAPGAKVVKAFSTLGAETMYDPRLAEGPVTVPVVGDDRAAKEIVAALARELGLEAVDVGPLRHARIIEGLHYLRANALGGRVNFHFPRDHARD